jgi:hypothetical protein
MTTVYVVMQCQGSYDSFIEFPIAVTSTVEKAEECIEQVKARMAKKNINQSLLYSYMDEWQKSNPRPTHIGNFDEWVMNRYKELDSFKRNSFTEEEIADMEEMMMDDPEWEYLEFELKE